MRTDARRGIARAMSTLSRARVDALAIARSAATLGALTVATLGALGTAGAHAAPVTYTFNAPGSTSGSSAVIAALAGTGSVLTASGSFTFNGAAPFLTTSDALGFEPGFAIYGSTSGTGVQSYSNFVGQVNGLAFSDVVGSTNVSNNNATYGFDVLTLNADASPKAGQNTLPTGFARQLKGFSVGDFTLVNVRLFWTTVGNGGVDFLSSNALPPQLPTFPATLALDFVRTSDPKNTANVPFYNNTVFFTQVNVTTAAAVPEPSGLALVAGGLFGAGVMRARARRRAQRTDHTDHTDYSA